MRVMLHGKIFNEAQYCNSFFSDRLHFMINIWRFKEGSLKTTRYNVAVT